MRTIKFRVFNKKSQNMINNVTGFAIDETKQKLRVWRMNKNMKDGMGTELFRLGDIELMQFTGLKDESDNEIWEGDIVETRMNHHGKPLTNIFHSIIRYNENVGCWQISYKNIDDKFVYDNIGFRYFLKVVGNIHKNKDLL